MIKKITSLSIIAITVIVAIAFLYPTETVEDTSVEELIIQGDIVMPTKVSRPGCEEDDRCYVPPVFTIKEGNAVTWINEDSAFHSVTSGFYDEPTTIFDSGHMDPFETFTVTFDERGTYDYFCTLHPWMKGQIIVK